MFGHVIFIVAYFRHDSASHFEKWCARWRQNISVTSIFETLIAYKSVVSIINLHIITLTMSNRLSSLYRTKSNDTTHNEQQSNHSALSTTINNGTRTNGLRKLESHSKDLSLHDISMNTSHYDRTHSHNSLTIFKLQDADDVVDWIDSIKSRYENLKSKQRQELSELIQKKQEEDMKRKLKVDMQQRHFDDDFVKLGKLLAYRDAVEKRERETTFALRHEVPESRSEKLQSFHRSSLWNHQRNEVDLSDDVDMKESNNETVEQDGEEYEQSSEDQEIQKLENYPSGTIGLDEREMIEISSSEESEAEIVHNMYGQSLHPSRNEYQENYRGASGSIQTSQELYDYGHSNFRRIDPYGSNFANSDDGQERYSAREEHLQEGLYEDEQYSDEEAYSEEEEGYSSKEYDNDDGYRDNEDYREQYQQEIDRGYDYRTAKDYAYYTETNHHPQGYLDSQAKRDESQESSFEPVVEEISSEEAQPDYENTSPNKAGEAIVQHVQDLEEENGGSYEPDDDDEFKSMIQVDDYQHDSRMEVAQVDLLGESSVDSEIESVEYTEYASTEASYSRQHSVPISIGARSTSSCSQSELENMPSNFDSQAEAFADEENEEDDDNDEKSRVSASTYSTLVAFASRALSDRSSRSFKESHAQSGYMADAEYTDNNLAKASKEDEIDSDATSKDKDFRTEEMAPVPDPFYAQELNEHRMKVNDLDENRSEGSLADESQFESHKSDFHVDRREEPDNVADTNAQKEIVVLQSHNGEVPQTVSAQTEMAEARIGEVDDKAAYLSDENPPAPIFKSIEEEEDPETVLQNLKEAEKKIQHKD